MKDEAVTREDRVASLKGMGARASGSKTHASPKAKATMSMTSNGRHVVWGFRAFALRARENHQH